MRWVKPAELTVNSTEARHTACLRQDGDHSERRALLYTGRRYAPETLIEILPQYRAAPLPVTLHIIPIAVIFHAGYLFMWYG